MFAISKILAPVDFSDACCGAARYASDIARKLNSEVALLYIAVPFDVAMGMESGAACAEFVATQQNSLKRQLEEQFWNRFRGLKPTYVVAEGDPATEIVRFAEEKNTDLIVMPTHGYGPFRRFLLGSVTAKVLHDVSCPVWTGIHLEQALIPEQLNIRKIACAVDLGPQTEVVLSWAAGMAKAFDAAVEIIHALPCVSDSTWRERVSDMARDQLAGYDKLVKADKILLVSGNAPTAVCNAARGIGADLLVVGRGHGTGRSGRLPSNAYAILRDSPCPVVSV